MKYISIFIQIVLVALLLNSCEEQPIPIPEPPSIADGRIMLLEDITGVSCVPCHNANVFIRNVLEETDGAIVAYGIHNGSQSTPHSNSKYDFRYPDVRELEGSIDYVGQPSGLFNRVTQANGRIAQLTPGTWQAYIDVELQKPQVLQILMQSDFDPVSRQVDIDVSAIPLENIQGDCNIHLVISESHLIDPQSTPNGVVEDYEHEHVMKASLTGLTGSFLAADLVADQTYRYNASYTVPDELNGEWKPENMEITAYVTASDQNNEVLQAFQIHMTE